MEKYIVIQTFRENFEAEIFHAIQIQKNARLYVYDLLEENMIKEE